MTTSCSSARISLAVRTEWFWFCTVHNSTWICQWLYLKQLKLTRKQEILRDNTGAVLSERLLFPNSQSWAWPIQDSRIRPDGSWHVLQIFLMDLYLICLIMFSNDRIIVHTFNYITVHFLVLLNFKHWSHNGEAGWNSCNKLTSGYLSRPYSYR